MKQVINCLKHDNLVINKKLKEVSVEEGMAIATELFQILNQRGDGIGLAANQVGIDAQVAVVNVRKPLVLINPKYISKDNEITYYEGCLSYPKKGVHTKRYETIHIQTAQEESGWVFSGTPNASEGKGSWEKDDTDERELRLLETICVQHEIDHLMGETIFDREDKPKPIISTKKFRRNELVTIKRNDAVKVLKYKKAKSFLDDGWAIN